ncbi:MAG: hypothetical protein E7417_06065 [Ruminococcaceae bacterium]|nr:hypothetical protein [Oscillospiraceae bacterium]
MRKIIALLLAVIMCLSLVGCSEEKQNTNNTSTEQDIKDCVIGTWERSFTTSTGEDVKQVMEIYKGGSGKFFIYSNNDGTFPATWEIQDNVLNFTYSSPVTAPFGFTLDRCLRNT